MIASQLSDEVEPLDVTGLDRADLIAHIHELERQRSAWELRVRACQERESLYLSFVNDMGTLLAASFEKSHRAAREIESHAAQMMETIQRVMREVEKV